MILSVLCVLAVGAWARRAYEAVVLEERGFLRSLNHKIVACILLKPHITVKLGP